MFRVEDKPFGTIWQVFTQRDPRTEGYVGELECDVTLEYDMPAVHAWPDGAVAPEPCLGRAPDDLKHYRVFRCPRDCLAAGHELLPGTTLLFGTWSEYLRLHEDPPVPDRIDDERWYDYDDRVDEAFRRRRQLPPSAPSSGSRDDVAAWLAKTHFITDPAIREVWYLPRGAPGDEIRLLELNDRFLGNETTVEPMDFGLDLEGAPYRLLVADVSSDQFEQIKRDPGRLPSGWFLDGGKNWRRRGA